MLQSNLLIVAAAVSAVSALWPLPTQLSTGTTSLVLASDFDIDLSVISNPPQDLLDAVSRTKSYLQTDQLEALDVDRGASYAQSLQNASSLSSLSLSFDSGHSGDPTSISEEVADAIENRVEGYTLTVPEDGSAATIKANSTLGLFRGLTTFGQLWYDLNNTTYTVEAPIAITDSPVYPYRGFMLDTARNYFPVSDILRTLDAMSWVKMTTFHWHMVDSQSFPLEVPEFPELSAKGAYGSSLVYSTDDVQNIISYAAARGIDVLPEIDTPGHTAIIAEAYPEHVACPGATPWATYANEPPAGQLRFASADTTNFTASLISSVSSRFPGKYFSTGGDELNTECYAIDEPTQADLNATGNTLEQALDSFTQSVQSVLVDDGKTPVVWEEMVLNFNLTLSNETIVMVWISSADAAAVAEKGFRLVQAPSDYFYLDCGAGGWVGDSPSTNSWCDPFKTWQRAYTFDPVANMTDAQAKLVIGGEHLLWTEQSHASNLDPIVWPRAAASAELFWSGPGGNVSEALPRLHDVAFRMSQRGVGAIALQPLWCALRPGVCDISA
ncbi:N-acetylhexosaminidase [Lentinula raphanica]|uniref:Beta-hexosaminidase n=1 Tax=Lentinula raphanica TaxID=153919 RepID=A0AA38P1M1_9AGAR|nr:N-acetylhexosaminidase [Lentinula raphanica]KAJ3834486.1 N-acetylhexosaminidase [Lentinula raphanica]